MSELLLTDEQIIREKIVEKLTQNEFLTSFPEHMVADIYENRCNQKVSYERRDLRELACFTIDGPNAKDLDDAVSLTMTEKGCRLGVHIADVTAFVPDKSELCIEAEKRGTTIYLPGQAIPMFPQIISEQLCSLNADADKKTVTMFINFDFDGNILGYEVCRSLIRSRIRGIYSEVNMIIEGTADFRILEKYKSVQEAIINMNKLAELLHDRRAHSGADVSSMSEYKYTFIDGMLDLSVCGNAAADRMICEFMVAANTCMARYFEENNLPGMYRIQKETGSTARYSVERHNHESLAICGGYLRFTSPIRRAADYKVHTVLTAFLEGEASDALRQRHLEEMSEYCRTVQALEDRAKRIERRILSECHMLYFARHEEDTFRGIIIGASRATGDAMIALQPYNIRIFGAAVLSRFIGQEFFVKVLVDTEQSRLRVGHISRVAVA